jgi:hypothetical protein
MMTTIEFPKFSGVRCLMMPYVQGDPASVPDEYEAYRDIISSVFIKCGDIGFLTIDESLAVAGKPHRGARSRYARALHTEAGILRGVYAWGGSTPTYGWGGERIYKWGDATPEPVFRWGGGSPSWGGRRAVTLDRDVRILIGSSVAESCAVWNAEHADTSEDGDIGHVADLYPYRDAHLLAAGEVCEIGILTPHESLPVKVDTHRQFLRIVGAGVHGREDYFTVNPLVPLPTVDARARALPPGGNG